MDNRARSKRRHFLQLGLAGLGAVATGSAAAQASSSRQPSFLCIYRPGASWLPGKPLSEQPLREHGRYMLDLYRRGIMRLAGPFEDGSGGAMLFSADDYASAQAIVDADPAVLARTFTYQLRKWSLVDWAALAKRNPR